MTLKLFLITLDGPNVPHKTEYLKAESKQIIQTAIRQAAKITSSNYYGYTRIDVQESDIKANEVPAPTLTCVEVDDKVGIKGLENKLVYHSKSIRAIKNEIREKRGDYDNTKKYTWSHTCKEHDNCEIYQKVQSLKTFHRKNKFYDTNLSNFSVVGSIDLEIFNFKPCLKSVADTSCGGCMRHYRCKECGQVHLTQKAILDDKKWEKNQKKINNKKEHTTCPWCDASQEYIFTKKDMIELLEIVKSQIHYPGLYHFKGVHLSKVLKKYEDQLR